MACDVAHTNKAWVKGCNCFLLTLATSSNQHPQQRPPVHWLDTQCHKDYTTTWRQEGVNFHPSPPATRHRKRAARGMVPHIWQNRVCITEISIRCSKLTTAIRPTLTTILKWLQSNHNVHPKAILTDCNKALTKAISDTYSRSLTPPKHLWCAVHVIKAACRRAIKFVSSHYLTSPLNR